MTTKLVIALSAGTGGVAPSLVHLAEGLVNRNADVPQVFYLIGVAIFFVLGALVALFFAETDAKKAFLLGIGLPALVATADSPVPGAALSALVPAAQAQTVAQAPRVGLAQGLRLTVHPAVDCKGCEVWFADAKGVVISKQILAGPPGGDAIAVPVEAATVAVADPKSNLRWVPLPTDEANAVTVDFSRNYNPIKDLRRGLGNYDLKPYDAAVRVRLN